MLDFVAYFLGPMVFGGLLGYLFARYQYNQSEICDNINLIKEDLANIQVQLSKE